MDPEEFPKDASICHLFCYRHHSLRLSPHAQPPGAGGRGGRGGGAAGGAVSSIEERTAGMQKLDGYFPLYWDERTGNCASKSPLRHRFPSRHRLAAGSDRTTSASTADRKAAAGRLLPARRAEGAAGAAQRIVPLLQRQSRPSGDRWRIRSPSRCCGASPWPPRATATCWWTPPISSCAMDMARRNALRPGTYRVDRTRSAVYMARTKAFPKNTEIEVTLTFANEAAGGRGGGGGRAGAGTAPDRCRAPERRRRRRTSAADCSPEPWRASRPRPKRSRCASIIRWSNCPTTITSRALDDPRAGYGGLNFVDYSVPIGEPMVQALHSPPSPGEEGSHRRHERAREAHRILGGSRRARGRARRRWSKARAGGTRPSKPPDSATPSRWPCCPTAPTPWTSATT